MSTILNQCKLIVIVPTPLMFSTRRTTIIIIAHIRRTRTCMICLIPFTKHTTATRYHPRLCIVLQCIFDIGYCIPRGLDEIFGSHFFFICQSQVLCTTENPSCFQHKHYWLSLVRVLLYTTFASGCLSSPISFHSLVLHEKVHSSSRNYMHFTWIVCR
jgi:hypothetical protein